MRMRRSALTVATIAALSFTAVAPAQARNTDQLSSKIEAELSSDGTNSGSLADLSGENGSSDGSSELGSKDGQDADAWWNGLNPVLKFIVGTAAATAFFVAFGMLRTLIYNVAGV